MKFVYRRVSANKHEKLSNDYISEFGDDDSGSIPEAEFDQLFDHLAETLKKHGSFTDGSVDADFSGYRYVDPIPLIQTVADDDLDPNIAIKAGLEAVATAHRPFAASFDFHPNYLLIVPSNRVFGTYWPWRIKRS